MLLYITAFIGAYFGTLVAFYVEKKLTNRAESIKHNII
jgi:hypothetical protein